MEILNFIGGLFGYILDFFYNLIPNYGVALILFTLFTKLILYPMSIQQQKSMALQSRMGEKQREIQAKYGADKNKYNEELMKLYEKEGFSPTSGCLPMLIQFPVLLGLFYAVSRPLTNVLHFAADKVSQIEKLLPTLVENAGNAAYRQITIISEFDKIQGSLTGILTGDEIERISSFSKGFNFLGLDLLGTPSFTTFLLLIPIFCFITSAGSSLFTTTLQGRKINVSALITAVLMSGVTTWFTFVVPAAVGLYWIFSNLFGFGQTYVLSKFYNAQQMCAKEESARIQKRLLEEQVELDKAAKNPKVYVPQPVLEGASTRPQKNVPPSGNNKRKKKR